MDEILLKVKKIENVVKSINYKNNNPRVLYNTNKKLDNILNNEIEKLIKLKNNNNGLFEKIPNELLEHIFSFLEIKDLFPLKLVCDLFNEFISKYIKQNITYCLIFFMRDNIIDKDIYLFIECNDCKIKGNSYIDDKIIWKKMYSKMYVSRCSKCKYKSYYDDEINDIRKIEFRYIEATHDNENNDLTLNYQKKNKIYIDNIYKKNTIISTRIFLLNNEKKNTFKKNILEIILKNSYRNLEIYILGKSLKNIDLNIENDKINSLIISKNLLSPKLKILNLNSLRVYDLYNSENNINFIDYIDKFYNINILTIEDNIFNNFNDIIFKNVNIKTINIISTSKNKLNIELLIKFISKNNIKNIGLNNVSEKKLYELNNNPYIDKIIIYGNFKYLKKYNKVKNIK